MAFIDRSDAIIVDAVVTSVGREKIARNDGSFRVVGYVFADDEIDYSLFNASTGSAFMDEEILETPLFEANVNEAINISFPLMSITNPNLKYLPNLATDNASISVGEEKGLSAGTTVRFYQSTNQNAKIVPSEIQDSSFKIELIYELLQIENEAPLDITPYGTAIYIIQRDSALIQSSQGSQTTFKLRPQSLSSTTWSTYGVSGSAGAKRTIQTRVKATGNQSGLSSEITVTIQEEFNR